MTGVRPFIVLGFMAVGLAVLIAAANSTARPQPNAPQQHKPVFTPVRPVYSQEQQQAATQACLKQMAELTKTLKGVTKDKAKRFAGWTCDAYWEAIATKGAENITDADFKAALNTAFAKQDEWIWQTAK